MHNLAPSAIEEILTFRPGICHACRELHEELKSALMQYLLATTNLYVYGADAARDGMNDVESNLVDAVREFDSHRKDTHFADCFALSWMDMPMRNAG